MSPKHARARRQRRRVICRLAAIILKRLGSNPSRQTVPVLPIDAFRSLETLQRKRLRALASGFHLAAIRLRNEQRPKFEELRQRLDQSIDDSELPTMRPVFQLRDVIAELAALENEFQMVQFNLRQKSISVTTPSIVLEDVDLGRFKIVLHGRQLGSGKPYSIMALDPRPAGDCEETTHPHVQCEQLCEGEGAEPIRHALAEGRLYDFFTIVMQILRTYNAGSAYTRLDDWCGVSCADCGDLVDSDRTDRCERCDARSCEECSSQCRHCDRLVCGNCSEACESCGERLCEACLSTCRDCGDSFCPHCSREGRCDDCLETAPETQAETTEAASEETEVLSGGLGETVVSA